METQESRLPVLRPKAEERYPISSSEARGVSLAYKGLGSLVLFGLSNACQGTANISKENQLY